MTINLKPSNEYARVELINIVFLQGDDYLQLEKDIDGYTRNEKKVTNYLLQWYDDDDSKYMSGDYRAIDINTPFLGSLIKIKGYKGYFLLSNNPLIGYAGLSKITRIIH